jgi:hypothetical protein
MRGFAIVFVVACGGSNSNTSAAPHNADSTPAREERPDCLDAIESWYFFASIEPKTPDNATDAQATQAIADMRARQHVLVDGCKHDQWPRETRKCFKNLNGSMAMNAGPPASLDDCKRMLTKAQLDGLQQRIAQTGETGLQ